jgi:DNA repair protein RadD
MQLNRLETPCFSNGVIHMFALRNYQDKAVTKALEAFKSGSKGTIIQLPTGAGKTIVIGELVKRLFPYKILILTHTKELVSQNIKTIKEMNPNISVDGWCAGLNLKDFNCSSVVVASIQSVSTLLKKKVKFNVIIIDECHRVPPLCKKDSLYQKILKTVAPSFVIGLSATPYRLGTGYCFGRGYAFNDIAFKAYTNDLIDEGFLSPLKAYQKQKFSTENLKIIHGEFDAKSVEHRMINKLPEHIYIIVDALKKTNGAIIFAAGVTHAKEIQAALKLFQIDVPIISAETSKTNRNQLIQDFKDKNLKALINYDVLTTGFDAPHIDLIILLRATASQSLYIQMLGRGLRISPDKSCCTVLDFGGNVIRFGSINFCETSPLSVGKIYDKVHPAEECPVCKYIYDKVNKKISCPNCYHCTNCHSRYNGDFCNDCWSQCHNNHVFASDSFCKGCFKECYHCKNLLPKEALECNYCQEIAIKPHQENAYKGHISKPLPDPGTYTIESWRVQEVRTNAGDLSTKITFKVDPNYCPVSFWLLPNKLISQKIWHKVFKPFVGEEMPDSTHSTIELLNQIDFINKKILFKTNKNNFPQLISIF